MWDMSNVGHFNQGLLRENQWENTDNEPFSSVSRGPRPQKTFSTQISLSLRHNDDVDEHFIS